MPAPAPLLGVCSWSLRPAGPEALAEGVAALGLRALQLGLKPLATAPWRPGWSPRRTRRALGAAGLVPRSGMVGAFGQDLSSPAALRATGGLVVDAHWPRHRKLLARWARLAEAFELPLVTLHAGCADPDDRGGFERLAERVAHAAALFGRHGARLALETGQEPPEHLLALLDAVGGDTGLNLDPANFVLHGTGDPADAVERLAPRALQVHVKDAVPSARPGAWGGERAVGQGVLPWPALLARLAQLAPHVDLMIEREQGDDRSGDVARAAALVREHAPWLAAR